MAALAAVPSTLAAQDGTVATVTGDVAVRDLGMVLMHEHVMVDFIGADKVSRSRYNADDVVRVALPHLREAKELGCQTIVECTPAFLGRNAALLQRLSRESGLHIISNTGYYGAAGDKHLPAHAFKESAQQLAQRWINEQRRGIDGTDILPGFMKIGVDPGGALRGRSQAGRGGRDRPQGDRAADCVAHGRWRRGPPGTRRARRAGRRRRRVHLGPCPQRGRRQPAPEGGRTRRVGRVRRHRTGLGRSSRAAREDDGRRRSSRPCPRVARCRLVPRR